MIAALFRWLRCPIHYTHETIPAPRHPNDPLAVLYCREGWSPLDALELSDLLGGS